MIAESPLALPYLLQGDVYLLAADKVLNTEAAIPAVYAETIEAETPMVREPVAEKAASIKAEQPQPEPVATTIPTIPVTVKSAPETTPGEFKYKGDNQKRFLVIVHYPDQDVMEPAHLAALESAMNRRGLSEADTAIFNIARYPGTVLKAIGAFFKPQKMLLLGSESFPVGLNEVYPLNLNRPRKVGKCDALYSFSFGEMMGNKDNTKAFWEQMKTL